MVWVDYQNQLKDPRWLAKSEEIKDRDHYTCKICGKQYSLNVHHKEYIDGLMAWEYPDHLLITFCSSCHSAKHGKAGYPWVHIGDLMVSVLAKIQGQEDV